MNVKRGARFVDLGNIASAGGLSSGIDLALHVVERYFGRDISSSSAYYLEYQGQGWMDPNSNGVYAQARISTAEHPLCPVCQTDVDPTTSPRAPRTRGRRTISAWTHTRDCSTRAPNRS